MRLSVRRDTGPWHSSDSLLDDAEFFSLDGDSSRLDDVAESEADLEGVEGLGAGRGHGPGEGRGAGGESVSSEDGSGDGGEGEGEAEGGLWGFEGMDLGFSESQAAPSAPARARRPGRRGVVHGTTPGDASAAAAAAVGAAAGAACEGLEAASAAAVAAFGPGGSVAALVAAVVAVPEQGAGAGHRVLLLAVGQLGHPGAHCGHGPWQPQPQPPHSAGDQQRGSLRAAMLGVDLPSPPPVLISCVITERSESNAEAGLVAPLGVGRVPVVPEEEGTRAQHVPIRPATPQVRQHCRNCIIAHYQWVLSFGLFRACADWALTKCPKWIAVAGVRQGGNGVRQGGESSDPCSSSLAG